MPSITLTINARTLAMARGAALTVGGLAAGTAGGIAVTRGAYRHDRLADPDQIVERHDGLVVERQRPNLGPLAMLGTIVLGAATAGGAAVWRGSAAAQAHTTAGLLHKLSSTATVAGGVGLVAGGVGGAMQYEHTTFRRE